MGFDLLAPHYRWMEFVLAGEKLQRCRTRFLEEVKGARKILIAGEGNGRFLSVCRRVLPGAEITVVDASKEMLKAARGRLEKVKLRTDQIEFLHGDILNWEAREREFDLLVTHFFLDCFPPGQLGVIVGKLAKSARKDAAWLLADFQVPSGGWRRRRAELIHAGMYGFFRVATQLPASRLTAPDELLRAEGFELRARQTSEWELLRSDLWQRGSGLG